VVFHGKQGGQGACQFRHHNLVTQAPRGGIVRSMGRCTEARVSLRNRETMGNEIRCVVTGVSLQWNSDYGLPAGPGPEVLYANSTRIRGGGGRICRRRIMPPCAGRYPPWSADIAIDPFVWRLPGLPADSR
jgi:hypothetical protein